MKRHTFTVSAPPVRRRSRRATDAPRRAGGAAMVPRTPGGDRPSHASSGPRPAYVSLDSSGRLRDVDTGRLLPRDVDLSAVRAVRDPSGRWRDPAYRYTADPFAGLRRAAPAVERLTAEASAIARRPWTATRRGRALVLSGSPVARADMAEFLLRSGPDVSTAIDRALSGVGRMQIVARVRGETGRVGWVPLSNAVGGNAAWNHAQDLLEDPDASDFSEAAPLAGDSKIVELAILTY